MKTDDCPCGEPKPVWAPYCSFCETIMEEGNFDDLEDEE